MKVTMRQRKANALCIDVGLGGTGFALFEHTAFLSEDKEAMPSKTWVRTLKDDTDYLYELEKIIKNENVLFVLCEGQAYMQSKLGLVCARSGALVKLSNLAGAFQGLCWAFHIPFQLVPVKDWKGQLPKKVVIERIKHAWPEHTCTTHDWDAVGIGFWFQNIINKK